MKKVKGFTLIELLIVVAIIAILAAIAVPNFLEAQVRSKVSRVKADMRTLATGIETYYIDNNSYPAAARGDLGINAFAGTDAGCADVLTFAIDTDGLGIGMILSTLTTPVAIVTTIPKDPFANTRGASFAYFADLNGWVLMSYGPDTDESEDGDLIIDVETVYKSSVSQPSLTIIALSGADITGGSGTESFSYDPSNGTVSPGDIHRVKQ